MSDKKPVLLIDFSALFRRAWHVASEMSIAFQSTVAGVNRAAAQCPDCLVAICCDGRGNWRKEIAPDYKANREKQPAALYGEMDRTLERLKRDGRLIWKCDGFEADDVMATACAMARTRGHEVRIATHDKDLYQLLGPGVDLLAIHTNPWEVRTHLYVVDKYGIETTQLADWLALTGDKSDNVIGCPGIGAKTATALLQKHGTIDGIYKAMSVIDGEPVTTPANLKSLVNNRANVETSRKLVALRTDAPIQFDEIYEVREAQPIDERDHMSEAEQDADKFFGVQQKEREETRPSRPMDIGATLDGATVGVTTQPEQEKESSAKISDLAPVAAAVKQNGITDLAFVAKEKTPEEIEEVSRPTEVATIVEYSRQLEPRSFRDAMVFAKVMHDSRVYSRYPTVGSIAAAVVRGREMGYGAGASLDIFHVADFQQDGNLRLMLFAHVVIDRAMRDPALEYFKLVESDAEHATYEAKVKRNAEPTSITYTIEDARVAGLIKPRSNWEKRPTEQCRKTAGVLLARVVAPWSAMGLYCPEEMGIDV